MPRDFVCENAGIARQIALQFVLNEMEPSARCSACSPPNTEQIGIGTLDSPKPEPDPCPLKSPEMGVRVP